MYYYELSSVLVYTYSVILWEVFIFIGIISKKYYHVRFLAFFIVYILPMLHSPQLIKSFMNNLLIQIK